MKMKTNKEPKKQDTRSASHKASTIFAFVAIPIEYIVSLIIFYTVFGAPHHFIDNNPANNPVTGDYLGTIYKGGYIVPILMTLFLVIMTFFIERLWTLHKARGKQSPFKFIKTVKEQITSLNIDAAKKSCDLQQGSIANVIKAGLEKYEEMDKLEGLTVEKKTLAVQKEIEEAEGMEMPMLERNLVIFSTIASIAVLLGLFGTVLGMIRAFAALAHSGAPDATALATGISEALINTAFGIGSSTLAICFYNYFTTRIDNLIYVAAEAGQTIIRTFSINHSDK
jgi:biopolymer transport protein ExbB